MLNNRLTRRAMIRFTIFAIMVAGLSMATPQAVIHSLLQAQTTIGRIETFDLIGTPAPEFDLAQVFGSSIRSEDLRGQAVVLDLWATWCGPCLDEIPNLNALAGKYKEKNV